MRGIIYWHPAIYEFFVRLMFGKEYRKRYTIISDLIPENSAVTDVCCGDCKLYEFLKDKNVRYRALDCNVRFVARAKKRGIRAEVFDLYNDEVPSSDIIVLQSSLYQFIPRHDEILRKLFHAARSYLIISETTKSYGRSAARAISFFAHRMTDPGDGMKPYRFSLEALRQSLKPYEANVVREFFWDEREYVVMIRKDAEGEPRVERRNSIA
jgi:hypothetical protein